MGIKLNMQKSSQVQSYGLLVWLKIVEIGVYQVYTQCIRREQIYMTVKLRKVGNSKTLTVPKDINTTSDEYTVKNDGVNIVFTPVTKRANIFATADWENYDYQKDIAEDPELQAVKPVGREVID